MSATGRAQIERFARSYPKASWERLRAIVCSDLARCVESAQILNAAAPRPLPVFPDPGLREISLGEWEGLTRDQIEERWPGFFAARGLAFASFVPPGGESFRGLARRVGQSLARWRRTFPDGGVCFVTHAGVVRLVVAHAMALPLSQIMHIPLAYAASCTLNAWPD